MRSTTPGLLLMTSLVVSAMPTVVPRGIENLNRIEKLTKYSVKFASSSTTKVPRDWHHLSPSSGVEGISSKLAHETSQEEPIRNIIVAVIDSGVDVNHEDLQGQVWINDDEVPNNGVDDDKNGYVDDVFGWNFIGGEKGQAKFVADSTLKNKLYLERGLPQFQIEQDTREATRELVRLRNLEEELSREGKDLSKSQQQYLEKLDLEVRKEYSNSLKLHSRYLSYLNSFKKHKKILRAAGLEHFSLQSVQEFTPSNEKERNAKNRLIAFLEDGADEKSIKSVLDYYNKNILYYYNIEWDSRAIVGDDYLDLSERYYGNNDVIGPFADHGTHVAGIIAASRDNGIGIQGITSSVKIMAIRAIPDGDERDKDVANAIYYAIDNGANIINMSFAKKYSPAKSYVDQAVAYGQRRGVLFIHAAGNTGQDTDQAPVFPMPISDSIRFSNWIEVGASTPRRGPNLVADFSNYGGQSVDFFAPGLNLYSTVAGNKYDTLSGTSMASPCVAGISAYLMARDFQITPTQIRSLLIKSSRRYPGLDVILSGASESGEARPVMVPFAHLSTYGSIVDLLNTID